MISIEGLKVEFGVTPLFEDVSFVINKKDRIALVGKNGAGKSTLLKILAGLQRPTEGVVAVQRGVTIGYLPQVMVLSDTRTVRAEAEMAFEHIFEMKKRLEQMNQELAERTDYDSESYHALIDRFTHENERFQMMGGNNYQAELERTLVGLGFDRSDFDRPTSEFSGGWRMRIELAKLLLRHPDVLLLDEPTNHLDIETIAWLEDWLLNFPGTLVFVSHDRAFADNIATRIVELDRGKLYSYPGNFEEYLRLRDERLRKEELANKEFDRILAEEEAWIRRGVKARLARNEGRVRNLEDLRRQRRERRDRQGRAIMQISEADRSGNIVFELTDLKISFDGKPLINDFSATVMRQDRIGIVGPNGCGKTTLIKAMLGLFEDYRGKVRRGTNVQYQYFDQYHEKLNLQKTVADNVAEGRRDVIINGKTRHVISYLGDFLFTGRRARSPASVLSGGEKNRLLLARMFARPCNVLVMDEPTNDLDLETLELLEELIASFNGTVIVISHDRRFIDKVATETWVFDGKGGIETIVGGWSDVLSYYRRKENEARDKKNTLPQKGSNKAPASETAVSKPAESKPAKSGISFTELHELEKLPALIESLETELAELDAKAADPKLYASGGDEVKKVLAERDALQQKLDETYARWELLEEKKNNA